MANLCNKNVPCGTKPIFILGPTGSGKSAVAVELAIKICRLNLR